MIVYTVICRARDAAVLVEESTEALTGNAPQVTTALLEHLRDNPNAVKDGDLKTFVHRNDDGKSGDDFFSQFFHACTMPITTTEDLELGNIQEHYFHLWFEEGVFYCCLSDDPNPREHRVCFAFLQNIAKDFSGSFSKRKIKNCNAYAMDKQFSPNLRTAMHYYTVNSKKISRDDKVNALLSQIEDMKSVLGRNIHLLLEREQRLQSLVETAEQAKKDSEVFKKKSRVLKQQTRRKSYKLWFIIAGLILLIIYIISATVCGPTFKQCGNSGARRLIGF